MDDKQRRDEELADLRWVMGSEAGRRFVRRLLVYGRLYGSVMAHRFEHVLPEERVLFNAGIQHVAQFLNDEVAVADPVGYQKMNAEAYRKKIAAENVALGKPMNKNEEEQ